MASTESADETAEFEAAFSEWETSRPKRQNRMAEERKATQTKAERSRRSDKGETRSSAINIRTTPAKKAKLDKASKAAKLTSTQLLRTPLISSRRSISRPESMGRRRRRFSTKCWRHW
jgi:hypothetical protein